MLAIFALCLACYLCKPSDPSPSSGLEKSCDPGFRVENFCLDFCPSDFICSQFSSVPSGNPSLSLDFSHSVHLENLEVKYSNPTAPLTQGQVPVHIQKSRGLFLDNTQIITIKRQDLVLAPSFTVNIWVLVIKPGLVFSDENLDFLIYSEPSQLNDLEISISLFGVKSFMKAGKSWTNILAKVRFLNEGSVIVEVNDYYNQGVKEFKNYWKEARWNIGKCENGGDGFVGFMYKVKVFNWIFNDERIIYLPGCLGMESEECQLCQGNDCIGVCCGEVKDMERKLQTGSLDYNQCNLFYYLDSKCIAYPTIGQVFTALIFNMDTKIDNVPDLSKSYFLNPLGTIYHGYNRGKYLNTGSKYTLSTTLNLSINATIAFWIKYEGTQSSILFKDSLSSEIRINPTSFSILYLGYVVSNLTNLNTIETWMYLTLKYSINSFYLSALASDGTSIKHSICTTAPVTPINYKTPFTLFAPLDYSNFVGWVYLFAYSLYEEKLYNPYQATNSVCEHFGFSNESCLWDCSYNDYEYENSCNSCGSSYPGCKVSSSYSFCYDEACISCDTGMNYKCNECQEFLVDKFCYPQCPITYHSESKNCIRGTTFFMNSGNIGSMFNLNSLQLIDFSLSPPIVAKDRGYYFKPSTDIQSSQEYYLPHEYSVTIWFKLESSGEVKFGFESQENLKYYATYKPYYFSDNWTILRLKRHPVSSYTNDYNYNIYNGVQMKENIFINNDNVFTNIYVVSTKKSSLISSRFLIKTDSSSALFVHTYKFHHSYENNDVVINDNQNCYYLNTFSCLNNCGLNLYYSNNICNKCDSSCSTCSSSSPCTNAGCYNTCNSCTDSTIYGCTSCLSGKFAYRNLCLDTCPGLFSSSDSICLPPSSSKIEWDFNINSKNALSTVGDLVFESSDQNPFQYYRGWYTNIMNLQNFQFSPYFGLSLWARPISSFIKIERKIGASDIDLQIYIFSYINMYLRTQEGLKSLSTTPNSPYSVSNWNYYSFRVINSLNSIILQVSINGKEIISQAYTNLAYLSYSNVMTTISGNSNFWILKFTYVFESFQSSIQDVFINDQGITCEKDLSFCPWTCEKGYFLSGTSCIKCKTECNTCANENSCAVCADVLCKACNSISSTTCNVCVDNAELVNSHCQCKTDYVLYQSSCIKCDASCSECTGESYRSCTKCVKKVNGYCTTLCPTFYTEDLENNCILDKDYQITTNFTSSKNEFNSQEKLINLRSTGQEGIVSYKQGLLLSSGVTLETTSNLVLSNIFTIELWINVLKSGKLSFKDIVKIDFSSTSSTLFLNNNQEFVLSTSFNNWYYFSLTIKTTLNLDITFKLGIAITQPVSKLGDYFLDTINSLMIINALESEGNFAWLYQFRYSAFENILPTQNIDLFSLSSCLHTQYRSGALCNECLGFNCFKKNDESQCENNPCSECDHVEEVQECNCPYGYFNFQGTCTLCDPACLTCHDLGSDNCNKCKLTFNNKCIDICQPGYEENSESICEMIKDIQYNVVFDQLNGQFISIPSHYISFFYASIPQTKSRRTESGAGPVIGYKRGVYLENSKIITTVDFKLEKSFTLMFWVNLYQYGKFLIKGGLEIEIQAESVLVKIENGEENSPTLDLLVQIPTENWSFFVVSINSEESFKLTVKVNQNPFSETFDEQYQDSIGKMEIGSIGDPSLKAWLYSLTWTSSQLTTQELDLKFSSAPVLWNCKLGSYLENDKCEDCTDKCNCHRKNDCSLCNHPECLECSSPESPCTKCSDKYFSDSNTCIPCLDRCESCSFSIKCKCLESFKTNYDNTCLLYCSDGDIDASSTCSSVPTRLFSFTFNSVTNLYISNEKYSLYMGNKDEFWPNYDLQDPWVLNQRGLYFFNTLATLGTASNPTSLLLGNTQQFELYLNILTCGQILTLANDLDIIISLGCTQKGLSFSLNLLYQTTNTLEAKSVSVQVNIALSTWYKVTWSLSLESLKLNLNSGQNGIITISNQMFNQHLKNKFTIGGTADAFSGYLYKIDVYNYEFGLTEPFKPCSCGICPSVTECLINCPPNTYFDGSCKSCSSSCKNGCSSISTCSPFNDPLCAKFTSLNEPCQTCVIGTVAGLRPCRCVTGAVFDTKTQTCLCKPDELIYNNVCDPCDRWLQATEVSGVFSENFLDLVLTFTIPVRPIICNTLFAPASAIKLGTSYSCTLSKDFKSLNIKLGKGYTVKNEILAINPKILKGSSKECGFNSSQISVKLEYSTNPPSPKAVLTVPSIVYYKCKEFIADGSLSTGYLSDGLLYKWEFDTVIPAFDEISNEYSSVSRIVIPSSKLSSGIVTVTLTVKNKFDVENSISSEVNIIEQDAMIVNFDDKVEYICKLSTTCQYSIKSIITCAASPSYKYEWSIVNQESYTQAEIDNFIKNQRNSNVIKILANSLPPSLLVLNVKVTEEVTGVEGIGKLSVKIKPEAPTFSSSRTSGDISSSNDFDISVTITSQVPITATVSYKWSCFKDSSPCNIDFTPNTEKLLIPQNSVKSKAFNKIGITVSTIYILDKTTGETEETSSSAEFKFNIVDWELPTVTLLEKTSNSYVKNIKSSETLSVIALISPDDGSFKLNWELSDTDNSLFLTPTTQSIVALDLSTLTKGKSYNLVLTLTLGNGESSQFNYPFTINSPPKKGSFTSSPTSGIEQSTEFTLITSGWVDDEENLPITYEYGYYYQSKANQITGRIPSEEYKYKFPYKGPVLTIYLRAYDSLGDYSEITTDIELSLNENFDKSAFVNGVEDLLSNVLYDDVASTVDSVISAVLKRDLYTSGEFLPPSNEDLQNMQKTVDMLQGFVTDFISTSSPSKELIDIGSSMVDGMAANTFLISDENFNKTTDIVLKLLESTSELGLNSEQGQKLLNAVGNSVKTDSEAVYNKTEILKKKESTIESITSGVLKNLVPNQQVSLSSGNMESKVMSLQPGTPTDAQLKISDLISASFPSDMYSQIPAGQSVGISITHSSPESSSDSKSSAPTTLSVSLFSNNAKVPLKLESSFITIEIPVKDPSSIKKPVCVYLNEENLWDSTGCTAIYDKEKNKDSFTCQCSHLSFFSAGEGTEGGGFFPKSNIAQTVDFASVTKLNATNALGFYISGGLIVLYVFVGIYAGRKDADDMKNVLDTIDKGNAADANPDPEIDLQQSINDEAIVVESIIIEGQALEPKVEPEPIKVRAREKLKNAIVNHKFFKIFFLFDPKAFRLSICTLIFTVLLGKMYFIGLFYEGEETSTTTFKDAIASYTFRDFLVMVYSTLIMFIIELITAYLSKNQMINYKWSKDENIRIIRRNRIRRILLMAFCWTLMIYFVWSIAMFCMNLNIGVSYKWIVNTLTGFAGEIIFMPSFEYFFKKYFFTLLGLFLQLRFCFYWLWHKIQKRKDKTQPSCDDLSSPGSTDKFGDS